MQVMASVTDDQSNQILENITPTTFQAVEGNSGRMNVATSGVAMNQTMPHTVRPHEARGCEMCHTLVDNQGRARNEHILAETFGLGTGAIEFTGDWALAAGTSGIALYDYKKNNELQANKFRGNAANHSTFPGLIVANDQQPANVEPKFDGTTVGALATATDVTLIRNFNPTPAMAGGTAAPTFTDLAVVSVIDGAQGKLLISSLLGRGLGNPGTNPSVGDTSKEFVLTLSGPAHAVAHFAPDVSDPDVFVAVGNAGVDVVRIDSPPATGTTAASKVKNVSLNGKAATELELAGDVLYVGTAQGTVEVLDLQANPEDPQLQANSSVTVSSGAVNGLAVSGFILYGVSDTGLFALDLQDPLNPVTVAGAPGAQIASIAGANELSVSQGHAYVAAGAQGVLDFDVRTTAAPVPNGNVATDFSFAVNGAVDVVVSTMPGQVWLLVLDSSGRLDLQKLDNRQSVRDRCFPDPANANCVLDLSFYDVTQSGRDPSFDPITGTFDAADPSSVSFQLSPKGTTMGNGSRLARPAQWEAIGTLTGRRYRDSFMPGSGVMSTDVMATMRSVQVCETGDKTSRAPGNLNVLGYPDSNGNCTAIQSGVVPMIKRPHKKGNVCRPGEGDRVCRPDGVRTTGLHLPVDMSRGELSGARRSFAPTR
jgi:hypothetical protein